MRMGQAMTMNSFRLCQDLRATFFKVGRRYSGISISSPGETSGRMKVDSRPQEADNQQVEEIDPQGPIRPQGVGHQREDDHRAGRTGDEDGQHGHHQAVHGDSPGCGWTSPRARCSRSPR